MVLAESPATAHDVAAIRAAAATGTVMAAGCQALVIFVLATLAAVVVGEAMVVARAVIAVLLGIVTVVIGVVAVLLALSRGLL